MSNIVIVEDSVRVPTGNYEMQCLRVLDRQAAGKKDATKVYDFVDYIYAVPVKRKLLDGEKTDLVELKISFFKDVRENSPVIAFVKKFGAKAKVGEAIDLGLPVGQWIKADVTNPKTQFGTVFSEISLDTVEVIIK